LRHNRPQEILHAFEPPLAFFWSNAASLRRLVAKDPSPHLFFFAAKGHFGSLVSHLSAFGEQQQKRLMKKLAMIYEAIYGVADPGSAVLRVNYFPAR